MAASLPDRLLRVDLTAGTIDTEAVPQGWLRSFLGGKGLGARYLYDAVGPDVHPLDPANVLFLMVGPLTGYLPGDGRFAAITKSPLTGLFLDSYAGGSFGPSFRARFPDHVGIAIEGTASTTQVLDLRGDDPSLVDTPTLEGATVDDIEGTYGDASVVTTGPAGEAGVAFATIAADGGDHHAGRGGAGAVMGAKRLKAIVAERTPTLEVPTDDLRRLRAAATDRFESSAYGAAYQASGTLETAEFADALSMLPTRGWREREFEGVSGIGIAATQAASTDREYTDDAIRGDFRVRAGKDETVIRGGSSIALGAGLGIDEFEVVTSLAAACDRLGLDVISAGNVLALAMLASEHGRIDRDLPFGDGDAARGVLAEIAVRSTPLGSILAEGVAEAAAALGMVDHVPTVKAMSVPSFDPRGAPAMALSFATSDRGACHRRTVPITVHAFETGWTPTQTAHAIANEQDRRALLWCLIVDDVLTPLFDDGAGEWLSALGIDVSNERLDRIGTRTWTLTRLFNVREGVDREDDSLPSVFREADDPDRIDPDWFERTLVRYYDIREWDRRGRPSPRLLERLELLSTIDADTPLGDQPRADPTRRGGDE